MEGGDLGMVIRRDGYGGGLRGRDVDRKRMWMDESGCTDNRGVFYAENYILSS